VNASRTDTGVVDHNEVAGFEQVWEVGERSILECSRHKQPSSVTRLDGLLRDGVGRQIVGER
jgi:hypothetical protein